MITQHPLWQRDLIAYFPYRLIMMGLLTDCVANCGCRKVASWP